MIDIDAIPLDLPVAQSRPEVTVFLATVEELPDGGVIILPHYGKEAWHWPEKSSGQTGGHLATACYVREHPARYCDSGTLPTAAAMSTPLRPTLAHVPQGQGGSIQTPSEAGVGDGGERGVPVVGPRPVRRYYRDEPTAAGHANLSPRDTDFLSRAESAPPAVAANQQGESA